jgi:hypothetical protein
MQFRKIMYTEIFNGIKLHKISLWVLLKGTITKWVAVCKGRITTVVSFSVKPKYAFLKVIKIEYLRLANYQIAFWKFAKTRS